MEKRKRATVVGLAIMSLMGCESITGDDKSKEESLGNVTIFMENYSRRGAYMTFTTQAGDHIKDARNEEYSQIGTNAIVEVSLPAYDTVMFYNNVPDGYAIDSTTGDYLKYKTSIHKMVLKDSASYLPTYPSGMYDEKVITLLPKVE